MAREYKIVFVGSMGSGKTTAIRNISDVAPISTEVDNSTRAEFDKATTTVAMDYGEVALADGDILRLYGTPGQARFDFMWKILGRGALGFIFLVDNSRPDPCQDLKDYLDAFGELLNEAVAVIGVGRTETHHTPPLGSYFELLGERRLNIPVFAVDVRKRDDVLLMLDTLFHQIEATLERQMESAG
jgi:signal recognition particle receptor subunit beta